MELRHALTLEVAYGSLLHERRRALHRRVLEALEVAAPAPDQTERLAHHAARGECSAGTKACAPRRCWRPAAWTRRWRPPRAGSIARRPTVPTVIDRGCWRSWLTRAATLRTPSRDGATHFTRPNGAACAPSRLARTLHWDLSCAAPATLLQARQHLDHARALYTALEMRRGLERVDREGGRSRGG